MVQASMECWPPLRGVESAPGKINLNKGMGLGNAQKRKISFEENVNDDKLYHNQLDEEIIPAATYEPANDMEKEDSNEESEDSDNYENQVQKYLGAEKGISQVAETHLMASCLMGEEAEMINQVMFENACNRTSGVKISEIQNDTLVNTDPAASCKSDPGSNGCPTTKGDMLGIDVTELLNPCDMMREMRKERRTSKRLQQTRTEGGGKQQGKICEKGSTEGNYLSTSNSFSVLEDNAIIARSMSMGVKLDVSNFDPIDMLRDLESARLALHSKQQEILNCKPLDEHDSLSVPDISENGEKLIQWLEEEHSDVEDFILVSSKKRTRKPAQRLCLSGKKQKKRVTRKFLAQNKKGRGRGWETQQTPQTHQRKEIKK